MSYHSLWITILILAIIIRLVTRVQIEVVIGTFLYGCFLVIRRFTMAAYHRVRYWYTNRARIELPKIVVPEKVSQINSVYQLANLEIVLGLDSNHRPIRYDLDEYHTLIAGNTGAGKALSLDTPIPTPEGWTTMEQVKTGDILFDETGKPCRVLGTSNIMINHNLYLVEFDDGSTIKADGEHLWHTMTYKDRDSQNRRTPWWRERRRKTRQTSGNGKYNLVNPRPLVPSEELLQPLSGTVKTTIEILDTLKWKYDNKRPNHSINITGPLEINDKEYTIHPYVLGVWLGDGYSFHGTISCADQEIIDRITSLNYHIAKTGNDPYQYTIYGLRKHLRLYGLVKNKHIPLIYLRGSYQQRLELLRGLMDTDGTINKNGTCEFSVKNERLALGVAELLRTLGIKSKVTINPAKLYGKDCGLRHRVHFTTNLPIFSLSRKLSRVKNSIRETCKRHYIVNITKIPSEPVKCIAVDSLSKLYLAGHGMIPTHNTVMINSIIAQLVGRGSVFLDNYELHLFDLKSYEKDYLNMWAPVISGYYPLDEDASTFYAISKLEEIVRSLNDRNDDRRVVVIIDELAALTEMVTDKMAKRAAREMVRQAAAKLRAYGALIAATQRPHFEVIDRNVTSQLDCKICLHTDDVDTAKMILRTSSKPRWDTTRFKPGEFIIRTPRMEKIGRSFDMQLPEEIDSTIYAIMEAGAQQDIRLRLLLSAIGGLQPGAKVPGVNKIAPRFEGLHNKQVEPYYRNYVNAGIFGDELSRNGKKIQRRVLLVDPVTAQAKLGQFIRDGQWKEDPPKATEEE